MDARVAAVLDRLYALDAEQRERGLPVSQRTRNLTRGSGEFLHALAIAMNARHVLEIGSSNGVSTIWLADAMRITGGSVIGTELLPERAEEADQNLREAGLFEFAEVIPGDALVTISRLRMTVDLVFIDAEKDDYSDHFHAVFPLVRPGGVIIADNVTSHDCSAYQTMLRERDDVESTTLAFERGLEITVRLPQAAASERVAES